MNRNLPNCIAHSVWAVLATTFPTIAHGAEAAVAVEAAGDPGDTIIVVGTSRRDITSIESAAPVDVVSAGDIAATGATNLGQALTALVPSFTLPQNPVGAFTSSIPVGAALRGLSSDQVLVLVNGKRRHSGSNVTRQALAGSRGAAPVDITLIPPSAIERIEVLRDGAAAQYGSDAIAGVINIVLRDKPGGGLSYTFGEYDRGDGRSHKVQGWFGTLLPNDGSLVLAFDAGRSDPANDTNPDNRKFYRSSANINDPMEQNHPYRTWRFGANDIKDQYNVSYNADLPLTEQISLYSFGTYSHRRSDAENFFEPPSGWAVGSLYLTRFPDGRLPVTRYDTTDYQVDGGIRWAGDGSTADLAANYGRSKLDSRDLNGFNPSYGAASPFGFDTGSRIFSQANITLDLSHEIEAGLVRPLTLSGGLAYRWEEYELRAGSPFAQSLGPLFNPVTAPGIFSGITDVDETTLNRKVYGAFVNLEAQITEQFQAGASFRIDDYSDFGSTTNGKLSLRYDFSPAFAVRATGSTGYRAPSLVQAGFSAFSVQGVFQPDGSVREVQQRTLRAGSPEAALLGGQPLKPEKSKNLSFGIVSRPYAGLSLTADIYQIKIDNRVTLSDQLTSAVVSPIFAGTPYANIQSAVFFTNLLDTRTRGIELSATYRSRIGAEGSLTVNAGFSANDNKITRIRDSGSIPGSTVVGRNTRGLIEEGQVKNKATATVNYAHGPFNVNLAGRRYGKWATRSTVPSGDQVYSPQFVTDLALGYTLDNGVNFTVGAINLFDSKPDRSIGPALYGVPKYSVTAPEGFLGAYYYARFGINF